MPVSTTLAANPSNAAEDPEHPTWVQGQGYGREPDESRSGRMDFNEVYEAERENARARRNEQSEEGSA